LCSQLNDLPAPLLVLRCTQQIESQASQDPSLDLYKLYRTTVPANTLAELRKQFNDDVANTDLTEYEPAVIASILKKFLRELPDPVIPVQWYDKFIEASSKCRFFTLFWGVRSSCESVSRSGRCALVCCSIWCQLRMRRTYIHLLRMVFMYEFHPLIFTTY
jgi:hypothetical protein